jgi:DHA1 family inner membrane transport protein
VNAGIAGGSLIGGAVVAANGVHAVVLATLVVCAATLPATWATGFLKPPESGEKAPGPASPRPPTVGEARPAHEPAR